MKEQQSSHSRCVSFVRSLRRRGLRPVDKLVAFMLACDCTSAAEIAEHTECAVSTISASIARLELHGLTRATLTRAEDVRAEDTHESRAQAIDISRVRARHAAMHAADADEESVEAMALKLEQLGFRDAYDFASKHSTKIIQQKLAESRKAGIRNPGAWVRRAVEACSANKSSNSGMHSIRDILARC